jgi:hypothetical protein
MATTPEERQAARAERQAAKLARQTKRKEARTTRVTARKETRSKIKAARSNKDLNWAQRRSHVTAAKKGLSLEDFGKTKTGLRLAGKSTRHETRKTKRVTNKANVTHMQERKASGDYSGSDLAYFNMARKNKNMKPRDYYAKYVK